MPTSTAYLAAGLSQSFTPLEVYGAVRYGAPQVDDGQVDDSGAAYVFYERAPVAGSGSSGFAKLTFVDKGNDNEWIEFLKSSSPSNNDFDFSGNWNTAANWSL